MTLICVLVCSTSFCAMSFLLVQCLCLPFCTSSAGAATEEDPDGGEDASDKRYGYLYDIM